MWGERVIMPSSLRKETLRKLHEPHLGIRRTQALARLYVWFPGISTQIGNIVDRCLICQERRNATPKIPVGSWGSQRKWGRLHIDFAGPFMGRYLTVLVDVTTGWLEAQWCAGPTTAAAIKLLQTSCAQFGLPDTVVSDNGPAFSSNTWLTYVKGLGADPLFSSPYAPYQNGIVERQIQTLKSTLLKITRGTPEDKLLNALAILRFVPSASEGSSATSRLLGGSLLCRSRGYCPT